MEKTSRLETAVNQTLHRWQLDDAMYFCRIMAGESSDPVTQLIRYPTQIEFVRATDNRGNRAEVSLEVYQQLSKAGWKVLCNQ